MSLGRSVEPHELRKGLGWTSEDPVGPTDRPTGALLLVKLDTKMLICEGATARCEESCLHPQSRNRAGQRRTL